jgi:uncharacterized protein YjbI with pentapeptide repeats
VDGLKINFNGAVITPAYHDLTASMIAFVIPDSQSPAAQVAGMSISNAMLQGYQLGFGRAVAHCLEIRCKIGGAGAFYGFTLENLDINNANGTGLLLYGAVFEGYIRGCVLRDCTGSNVELRNPTQGTGGVLSSLNFIGCDIRGSGSSGILCTADTAFQETGGFSVEHCDFIVNQQSGITAPGGMQGVHRSHFENCCAAGSPDSLGAIYCGGATYISNCEAASLSGVSKQEYLVDLNYSNGASSLLLYSTSRVFDLGHFHIAKLTGTGVLFTDGSWFQDGWNFVGESTTFPIYTFNNDQPYLGTAGGSGDALTITPAPPLANLVVGAIYRVKAPNSANATTTPTITITGAAGSFGAKTIVKRVSTALAANDILANKQLILSWDGTNMVLQNPTVN